MDETPAGTETATTETKKEEIKKEEAKVEMPPGPKANLRALGPKANLRALGPKELEFVMNTARDPGVALEARKLILAGYDVPEKLWAPDPGWTDKTAKAAATALMGLIGVAAASAALVVTVSSVKALLVAFGVITPEANPALPPTGQQLHLPPTASGAGGGGLCGDSFRPSGGGRCFSPERQTGPPTGYKRGEGTEVTVEEVWRSPCEGLALLLPDLYPLANNHPAFTGLQGVRGGERRTRI